MGSWHSDVERLPIRNRLILPGFRSFIPPFLKTSGSRVFQNKMAQRRRTRRLMTGLRVSVFSEAYGGELNYGIQHS